MRRAILAGALVSVASLSFGQLVANGGFETGDFTGWTTQAAASGSLFGVDSGNPHTGTFSAYFGAVVNGDPDWIYQDLATIAGTTYHISMWVDNEFGGGDDFYVNWEGNSLYAGTAAAGWHEMTFDVQATTSGSRLAIGADNPPSYTDIDDVSVTPVPEPASLAALGIGALALIRKRRK